MANLTDSKNPFDRLPEPYRTWAIADRNSSELEGIPCSAEEAVRATEKFIAAGDHARMARIAELAQEAERRGESFYETAMAEELRTRPPKA